MPPITRNKDGNREGPKKAISQRSSNTTTQRRTMNNNYITLISDHIGMNGGETDIVDDLRNKIGTEFELSEMKDEKLRFEDKLQSLTGKLNGKQIIITNLQTTIGKLSKSLNNNQNLANAEVQTEVLQRHEKLIQCSPVVQERHMQRTEEVQPYNACKNIQNQNTTPNQLSSLAKILFGRQSISWSR
ncbi:hypothetical protein QE152_g5366 [Popillia japonica]|uniref:Uncharacterized protein n=1 Tax=Popillia japonica TaxID=7064 RepID=A0AAW1MT71_POPJA